MRVGDVLILGVDPHVAKAVGGSGGIEAVGELPHVDPVGADHGGMLAFTPSMLERQAPVRCVAVEDGVRRFIRAGAEHGESAVRGAVGGDLRVEGFIPERVGAQSHDLLTETAIEQHRRVGSHRHA